MRLITGIAILVPGLAIAQEVDGVSIGSIDRIPTITSAPDYPRKARRDRIEGDVEVCFNIDHAGRPNRISVRRSDHRWFEKPAIRAVRSSRYAAVPRHVRLTGIKTCRVFEFRLNPARRASG